MDLAASGVLLGLDLVERELESAGGCQPGLQQRELNQRRWESSPPMGPPEIPTRHRENQAAGRRKHRARQPRRRRCLLKGCEQKFRPRRRRQRYCSERCRQEARQWSRWKAQQRYRETAAGQQRRNGQSRRYRERVKSRKTAEPEAVSEAARVIPQEHFFRAHVRPAGVLRAVRAPAAKSLAAFLFTGVPASAGAGPGAGAALETGAHSIRTY